MIDPLNTIPGYATDSVGSAQPPPQGCRTFLLLFAQLGVAASVVC